MGHIVLVHTVYVGRWVYANGEHGLWTWGAGLYALDGGTVQTGSCDVHMVRWDCTKCRWTMHTGKWNCAHGDL